MKRIFTLLALAAFALTIFAQSPDLMTYQAVLRDAENHLLTNQSVAIQISILQTTPNGTAVFTEVHSLSTNANGLISLVIGDGVGDDLSTVDWSNGPYFLKTETDPTGGSSYTITSTSQLLSVPYAQYADEAGNVFSGAYGDLTGSPVDVSEFVNDAGYLTGVTGGEPAFDGWDKNVLDDFSGAYGDLAGAPTNVSHFTNDAGYLSSELWSQSGSNLYYQGGHVGIGITDPLRPLTINSGAANAYASFNTTTSGFTISDGFIVGIQPGFNSYVWNFEAGPIIFGTNSAQRMVIESGGDIGIGVSNPDANLQVVGDAKFGSSGIAFTEMREITGTTAVSGHWTSFSLPAGYTSANTRVLSVEVNYNGIGWVGQGFNFQSAFPIYSVSYQISGTTMWVYYPNIAAMHNRAYRALIMQIAP